MGDLAQMSVLDFFHDRCPSGGCDVIPTKHQSILLIHTELESVWSQSPQTGHTRILYQIWIRFQTLNKKRDHHAWFIYQSNTICIWRMKIGPKAQNPKLRIVSMGPVFKPVFNLGLGPGPAGPWTFHTQRTQNLIVFIWFHSNLISCTWVRFKISVIHNHSSVNKKVVSSKGHLLDP